MRIFPGLTFSWRRAIGLSGKDGGLVTATKVTRTTKDPDSQIEQAVDLGFVGDPTEVDTSILDTVCQAGMIPIVAPIAADREGETYNINADTMAGAIAAALGAARLFLLTDVPGVLDKQIKDAEANSRPLSDYSLDELRAFSPLFDASAVGLHATDVVNARQTLGGTAPEQVRAQLAAARERHAQLRVWAEERGSRLPTLERLVSS